MTRTASLLATLGLALVFLAAQAPSAKAYVLFAPKWKSSTVRYYNSAPKYAWSVHRAAWAINHTGARIRLVETHSSRRAQITVFKPTDLGIPGFSGACAGQADWRSLGSSLTSAVINWTPCNREESALLLAHEFLHALGLNHEKRRCALMNPTMFNGSPDKCDQSPNTWSWRCRVLEGDDVRGLVTKYGGKVRKRGAAWCPRGPAPAPPSNVAAAQLVGVEGVRLTFTPRAASKRVTIVRTTAACATTTDQADGQLVFGQAFGPGPLKSPVDDQVAAGHYCYAFWSLDTYGQPSKAPSTLWVDVLPYVAPTPPPPPPEEF